MSSSVRHPAVELLASVAWTIQLGLFLVLALGPLVAGFVAPLGPPQYTAHVADVSPTDAAPEGAVAYGDLPADSRAAFDEVVSADGDRITRRTDEPPRLIQPGERTVVRGEFAVRVVATESGPPLRPAAVLAGLLGSVVGTLVGAAVMRVDVA